MITSYEVGAVLKIVDQVSPALGNMAKLASEFGKQLEAINKQLLGTGDVSISAAKIISQSFAGVDTALISSLDYARALKIEIGEIGAATRAVNRLAIAGPGGGASGGGGGGREGFANRIGSGGGHFGRVAVGQHGITAPHYSMPSNPVMAAAASVVYGAWLDANMEDAISQIEYHTGEKDTPENSVKYRKIIQDAMSKTGSSLSSVVEATKQEVRMFKGTPGGGVDVLPEMLMASATEAKVKGTSLEEAMTSLIGYAHMLKQYSPENIKKLAPVFAFLSAANPSSLGSMERASSYAVPILESGMDIDPLQTLLLGTALTRAGATNTKSGTWLRNMALAAMPGTSLMSKMAFDKHEESLKALGLVDDNNKPTWFTDGKPDLIKMLGIAGEHAAGIPLDKRGAYEKQLFGAQGFGGFALLADPAVKQQIAALGSEMNSQEFKNRYGNFMQDYSAKSPLQAGRQMWADAQIALMDLGKTILPSLVTGIKDLDKGIKDSEAQIKAFAAAFQPAIDALYKIGGVVSGAIGAIRGDVTALPKALNGGTDPGAQQRLDHFKALNPSGLPGKQSSNEQVIHTKIVLNVDGRALGEATSVQLARASTFPTQAAYGDGYASWMDNSWNAAT